MIEPQDKDVGRRVKYLDGTPGTLMRFTYYYAFVRFDVRKREDKQWVMAPGEVDSPTAFAELEWADGPA